MEYYTSNLDENTHFDYVVNVNVKTVAVSPDQQRQIDSLIKRDVDDGFDYVKDVRGNVKKDSLAMILRLKNIKQYSVH